MPTDFVTTYLLTTFNVREVYVAIEALVKNVCPGIYSFPVEFFHCYWNHIQTNVTKVLQEVFTLGDMPYQWHARLLFFIPKMEGVIFDIKKWRPITIVNTVYRIYAKVHSLRMQPLLNDIIHKSQIGFEAKMFYFL